MKGGRQRLETLYVPIYDRGVVKPSDVFPGATATALACEQHQGSFLTLMIACSEASGPEAWSKCSARLNAVSMLLQGHPGVYRRLARLPEQSQTFEAKQKLHETQKVIGLSQGYLRFSATRYGSAEEQLSSLAQAPQS